MLTEQRTIVSPSAFAATLQRLRDGGPLTGQPAFFDGPDTAGKAVLHYFLSGVNV
jgi:hypothetical protein